MKKKFVTAMATALVVGAASTTFAAANPFSDVPAGHWAYDAVTQLASEGVVDGYGDGTYLGNRNITRYEMAQMVARAMAKVQSGAKVTSTGDSNLKSLMAEFKNELDNLGIRVSELEKYADKVQWTGELRYRYWSDREEITNNYKTRSNKDSLQLRLFPTAEVNNHWKIKGRLTGNIDTKKDTSTDMKLTYAFAEGNYSKFNLKVGKQPLFDNVGDGLVLDDFFTGARVEIGSKWKLNLEAGRWDLNNANSSIKETMGNDDVANYQGGELIYDTGSKFKIGGQYRHLNSSTFKNSQWDSGRYNLRGKVQDDADIWGAGFSYKFDRSVKVAYAYAKNPSADDYNFAWAGTLSYKGADKNPGTWGIWAGYRYVGDNASFTPTYDTFANANNKKGVEVGLGWSPLKNTLTHVEYFKGKSLVSDKDVETLYGRVSFFF